MISKADRILAGVLGGVFWLSGLAGLEAGPAAGVADADEITELRKEVGALRDEVLKLRSELGADGKSSFVKIAGKESSLRLGGLLQVQADFGDRGDIRFSTEQDRFYLRRARLNAVGDFLEDFDFRLEAELSGSLGEAGGLRAQLTDGYITWKKVALASVRAGQFKTPYGYEQLALDPRLFTIERSLGNDRLTLGRQVGAQVGGEGRNRRITYSIGTFNGSGSNSSSNDNEKFTWVGRLAGVPLDPDSGSKAGKLAMGFNGFWSDDNLSGQPREFGFDSTPGGTGTVDNIFIGSRTGWGADSQYTLGRLDVWAEYLRSEYEPDNNTPSGALDAEGWYVQGSWYFLRDKLQGVLKYDEYDPNLDVGGDAADTWTAGLNYYIKGHDLKVQLNYLRCDNESSLGEQDKVLARLQTIF